MPNLSIINLIQNFMPHMLSESQFGNRRSSTQLNT